MTTETLSLEYYAISPAPEQAPGIPEFAPSSAEMDATLMALKNQIDSIFTDEALRDLPLPPPKGEEPNDCSPNGHG
jgi:hypothetical protein